MLIFDNAILGCRRHQNQHIILAIQLFFRTYAYNVTEAGAENNSEVRRD